MVYTKEMLLKHYGTKGMHWGVRKGQSISSNRKSASKKYNDIKKTDMSRGKRFVNSRSTQNFLKANEFLYKHRWKIAAGHLAALGIVASVTPGVNVASAAALPLARPIIQKRIRESKRYSNFIDRTGLRVNS